MIEIWVESVGFNTTRGLINREEYAQDKNIENRNTTECRPTA